jgi:hypothetical protein
MKGDSQKGHYFLYCQLCELDGKCVLRHNEFMGVAPNAENKVDDTPYRGHEDVRWAISGFQGRTPRSACTGLIRKTDSIYYPLDCECGTALSSLTFSGVFGGGCAKIQIGEKGQKILDEIEEYAKLSAEEEGIDVSEVDRMALLREIYPYDAAMMY